MPSLSAKAAAKALQCVPRLRPGRRGSRRPVRHSTCSCASQRCWTPEWSMAEIRRLPSGLIGPQQGPVGAAVTGGWADGGRDGAAAGEHTAGQNEGKQRENQAFHIAFMFRLFCRLAPPKTKGGPLGGANGASCRGAFNPGERLRRASRVHLAEVGQTECFAA